MSHFNYSGPRLHQVFTRSGRALEHYEPLASDAPVLDVTYHVPHDGRYVKVDRLGFVCWNTRNLGI